MSAAHDSDAKALLERVGEILGTIPRAHRPRYALWLSPEIGVRLMSRGELASRLAEAGLMRESREATRRCRADVDLVLAWCEAGESSDDAEAGFRTFPMPRGNH